jgi:DNA invertase Pin-like site-specific DNA recombinase
MSTTWLREIVKKSNHTSLHSSLGHYKYDTKIISGCNNHNAKFSEKDIASIKKLLQEGKSLRSIAKMYKCSHQTIMSIKHNKSYKDIAG